MRMKSKDTTAFYCGIRPLVSVLLCSIAIVFIPNVALAGLSSFSEGVRIAAEYKSKAEEWASKLKHSHDDEKISDRNYNTAQSLYIDARSAFEGWISGLQSKIEVGEEIQTLDDYKASLEDAVMKAEMFTVHVEGLFADDTHRGVIDIAEIVAVFVSAGVEIWKEYRAGDKQKQETLVKRLDSVRWKSFDEI